METKGCALLVFRPLSLTLMIVVRRCHPVGLSVFSL